VGRGFVLTKHEAYVFDGVVKLEVSSSGSYGNASQGIFEEFNPPASLTISNLGRDGDAIGGYSNRLNFVEDPVATSWQTLGTATANGSGFFQFIDTNVSAQRFYR